MQQGAGHLQVGPGLLQLARGQKRIAVLGFRFRDAGHLQAGPGLLQLPRGQVCVAVHALLVLPLRLAPLHVHLRHAADNFQKIRYHSYWGMMFRS